MMKPSSTCHAVLFALHSNLSALQNVQGSGTPRASVPGRDAAASSPAPDGKPLLSPRQAESSFNLMSLPSEIHHLIFDQLVSASPVNSVVPQLSAIGRCCTSASTVMTDYLSPQIPRQFDTEQVWRKKEYLHWLEKSEVEKQQLARKTAAGQELIAVVNSETEARISSSQTQKIDRLCKKNPAIRLHFSRFLADTRGKAIAIASNHPYCREIELVATGLEAGAFSRTVYEVLVKHLQDDSGAHVSLDLSGSELSCKDCQKLTQLLTGKQCLRTLSLRGIRLNADYANLSKYNEVPFLPFRKQCQVSRLDLSGNPWLSDWNWTFQASELKTLRELDVSGSGVDAETLIQLTLSGREFRSRLQKVRLEHNGLSEPEIQEFTSKMRRGFDVQSQLIW